MRSAGPNIIVHILKIVHTYHYNHHTLQQLITQNNIVQTTN